MAKYKIDDRLRYFGESDRYTTKGESYIISEVHEGYVCINDETGDTHELTFGFIPTCFEHVTEESPDVPDLIANLGRRLSVVEVSLAPKECEEVSPDEFARVSEDVVNSPSHYTQGDIEVIDYIDQVTDAYVGRQAAYAGNVIKYVSRAPYKNQAQDIRKAIWYAERLADAMEAEQSE